MEERFRWKQSRVAVGLIVLSSLLLLVSVLVLDTLLGRILGILGLVLLGVEIVTNANQGGTIRVDERGLSLLTPAIEFPKSKTVWSVSWQEEATWLFTPDTIAALLPNGRTRQIHRRRRGLGEWENFERIRDLVAARQKDAEIIRASYEWRRRLQLTRESGRAARHPPARSRR